MLRSIVFEESTRSPKFGEMKFLAESVYRARFIEVLPNSRHAGVFRISMMVNLGIGFQEPWTRHRTMGTL